VVPGFETLASWNSRVLSQVNALHRTQDCQEGRPWTHLGLESNEEGAGGHVHVVKNRNKHKTILTLEMRWKPMCARFHTKGETPCTSSPLSTAFRWKWFCWILTQKEDTNEVNSLGKQLHASRLHENVVSSVRHLWILIKGIILRAASV
jgi:hypothetical protein